MILLDERFVNECSKQFVGRFGGLGVAAWLEYGDVNFWAGGTPKTICIEVKRALDLLISIERTGRLDNQRRKALAIHHRYYLILHGFKFVRPDNDSHVAEYRRGGLQKVLIPDNNRGGGHPMLYRRMDNYLNTLQTVDGVVVKETADEQELVEIIKDLYFWWQKPEEEHTSTLANAVTRPIYVGNGSVSLVRRLAAELPGVGIKKSKAVDERFKTVKEMVAADEKEWEQVDGIGKELASRIVSELRNPTKAATHKRQPWVGTREE